LWTAIELALESQDLPRAIEHASTLLAADHCPTAPSIESALSDALAAYNRGDERQVVTLVRSALTKARGAGQNVSEPAVGARPVQRDRGRAPPAPWHDRLLLTNAMMARR
jgi:hypothetical protein